MKNKEYTNGMAMGVLGGLFLGFIGGTFGVNINSQEQLALAHERGAADNYNQDYMAIYALMDTANNHHGPLTPEQLAKYRGANMALTALVYHHNGLPPFNLYNEQGE